MIHLHLTGLFGRSWAIQDINLSQGLWVLLLPDQHAANELARQLAGIDAPTKGSVRLNGKEIHGEPAARCACATVLVSETGVGACTVRSALDQLAVAHVVTQSSEAISNGFGLQSLRERTLESLSNAERRQVAFAIALARNAVQLSVYCEPRLDLTDAQISALQVHMSERAHESCVICITSSLHDARLLGGPHAQITRSGWAWVHATAEAPVRVVVEGTGLRSVGAELALNPEVSQLVLQTRDSNPEVMQLSARSGIAITMQVAHTARQNRAKISRLCVQDQEPGGPPPPVPNSRLQTGNESPISGNHQHCNLVRTALACQWEILRRASLTLAGALLFLGGPLLTAVYAVGQVRLDRAGATLNALQFLITYIVPCWTLLLVRLFNRQSSVAGLVEALARFGANRRMILCANWALISLVCAAVASASAVLAVLNTAGAAGSDLGISAWIATVGATSYVAIFAAINACWRSAWPQWAFLFADLVLGGTALGLSAFFPHAHLVNLIGAPGAIDFAQRTSFAVLGLFTVLAFGLTCIRTRT